MKKTKRIATSLLLLTIMITFISWPFRQSFWGGLFFAASEAAMVGALADWFAIVALFRHPLGLRWIPHTAIIPQQRERIIEGISHIVENDWLSLEYMRNKILAFPMFENVLKYIEAKKHDLEHTLAEMINHFIGSLEPEDTEAFLQQVLKDADIFEDKLLNNVLTWALEKSQKSEFEQLTKGILQRSIQSYTKKGGFFRRLTKGMGESLDILNYDQAAQALTKNIISLLKQMQSPQSLEYQNLRQELHDLNLPRQIANILSQSIKKQEDSKVLVQILTHWAIEQLQLICLDERKRESLERRLKEKILYFLEHYHSLIGIMVKEKLLSLDEDSFVASLEDKVGEDLQWIRINGTIIGALIGTLQYIVRYLI